VSRPVILAIIGAIVVGLAIGMNYWSQQPDVTPEQTSAGKAAKPKPAVSHSPRTLPPAFDVVRINPNGNTVIGPEASSSFAMARPNWAASTPTTAANGCSCPTHRLNPANAALAC
jgi:hypothetical protein